jgi:hypothetical protein
VRTRIALATAAAVIVIPATLFALFSSSPPASAGASHVVGSLHEAGGRNRTARIDRKLMSYSEAQKVAKLATFYNAVSAAQEAKFYQEVTFFKELAFMAAVAAANSVNAIPAAWLPTAMCEESGRDDPNYGYFGIKAWNGFDGYPSAGGAPLSVQLAWEAAHGQGPPDAPGQCHSY